MPASHQPKNDNVIEAQGEPGLEVNGGLENKGELENKGGIEVDSAIEVESAGLQGLKRPRSDNEGPNLQSKGKLEDKDKSQMIE
ncbi:hypothetical protein K474DRAFT_1709627 [Panus rudis PR-1116 ss-1]|nr:hypothetical protein K474DRAFT_1709627 [Panus rudis PR-1116 ss-1]